MEFEANDTFVKLVELFGSVNDEICFRLEENGVRIKQPDRGMITFMDFFFETDIEGNKEELKKGVVFWISDTSIQLFKSMSSNFKVIVEKDTITLKKDSKEFVIRKLKGVSEEKPPIEELKWEVKKTIDLKELLAVLKSAELVSDSLVFEVSHKGLELTTDDGDFADFRELLELKGLAKFKDKSVRARYPLEYLRKIEKLKTEFDKVEIHLNKDFPLKLAFKKNGEDTYKQKELTGFVIVAPRVED